MARFQATEFYNRPQVTLSAAMTVDGKIATRFGDARISSRKDLARLHKLRSMADAVMIGIGTQRKDNPYLTVRHVKGRNPIRVIVDSFARVSPDSRIFYVKGGRVIVAVSKRAPKTRVRRLERAGAEVICAGTSRVDLKSVLSKLHRMGVRRVLLEGGGKLNWSMLVARLVDEIRVTVAPLIVGGERATSLVEGLGVRDMNHAIKLSLANTTRDGNELVLNYKVKG